ncbi:MAG: hypothetical protein JEZ03_12510 [Bacteroidales bacterium]|nr:hypothetical protein [Bacteroidales bacterium]
MFKKIVYAFSLMAFLSSCDNSPKSEKENESSAQKTEIAKIHELSIEDFIFDAGTYTGKEIKITGTIAHVCSHGGKRMFIMGENPDQRIEVTPNEDMAVFEPSWEGTDIVINGLVSELRVDEAYLQQWEAEAKTSETESEKQIHTGEPGHEHHEGDVDQTILKIENFRKQIEESGKDHISFYSIVCNNFELIK